MESQSWLDNERLLKAAPDLLAALRAIVAECPNPKLPYGARVVEIARAAIARAEGKDE